MNITGFESIRGTPFVYLQSSSGVSVAFGIDSEDSDIFKLSLSASANAVPSTGPQMQINPSTNGNITFTPNGSGLIAFSYMTAGVVQSDSSGQLTSSNGTDGQLLIGGGTAPSWASITSTGGSIDITPGPNSLNIDIDGGASISTVVGNAGTINPINGVISIITSNATVLFTATDAVTLTLDFAASPNLALGSNQSSHSIGTHDTAYGIQAMDSISDGNDMTAIGYHALKANVSGNSNTAVGSLSLLALTNTSSNGYNTAVGAATGYQLATGSYNTLIGPTAGGNYTGAESSNICINSPGTLGETNTLRIGASTGAGNQTLEAAFICGIDGVNVGSVATVVTMASDQLGTATVTAGTGISVTPGANTITISATGSSFTWNTVSGTSQAAAVNNGYITNNSGLVTVTLPASASVGNIIRIAGKGSGGWSIAQNSDQTIHFDSSSTTTGASGSLSSTNQYDTVELLCITTNTDFSVLSSVGNLTII